mgnify:CR=1 FL=1
MTYHGYAGKILRLDMTNRKAVAIDTAPYRRWGGVTAWDPRFFGISAPTRPLLTVDTRPMSAAS